MANTPVERPGRSAVSGVPAAAHAAVTAAGVGVLAWFAFPVQFDGVLHGDRFAWSFVLVSALVAGSVGASLEGRLLRSGKRSAATIVVAAFGLIGMPAPALMCGRWFAADDSLGSSAALGVALVGWLATAGLQLWLAYLASRPASAV